MDLTTIIGLLAGLFALVGGFLWEGGKIGGLMQQTAALIVFGGTIAAVMVSFPLVKLKTIPHALRFAFVRQDDHTEQLIEDLVGMATTARRNGVLQLERTASEHPNLFLREGIQMVVDGTEGPLIAQIMELEMDAVEHKHEGYAKIFESAGGYAPTMGIIGTVMGLIHVLGSLQQPTELGPAIAVAFTATLYGVASANIIFLPIASKIKSRSADEIQNMELLLQGVLAVQNGEHPNLVRKKLNSFTPVERYHIPVAKEGFDETAR
ncbi:flagellar motor protein [Paenibacillus pini]|uniref:Flagellar motor rotation protein MotA n=1 Tax=Paenibacillus pini JCM 16418 TaxID=1236976 RepID=W7YSZ8_9BACL|nr:flagellar motor protein [Paenibacillus pini]GAF10318.1 flagellar motor rotation protein MotA [Paenibacillus pini JCM 16418]